MYVVNVQIHVKPERIDDFARAALENASSSRGEPGNMRFDVIQNLEDPSRFIFYEVYRTPDDFKRHQEMPHYVHWRDQVKDWMVEPRVGTKCRSLFPPDQLGHW